MKSLYKFIRVGLIGLIFLFLLVLSAGCMNQKAQNQQTQGKGYEVVDDQKTVVKLPRKPQRIMTTHFHLDNMLLGVVPEERVVAVSDTMDDTGVSYSAPGQFAKPKRYHWDISFEQVIAFKPDLIIARPSIGEERIQSYRDMGIPVYVSAMPVSVKEIKQKITNIAAVCGEPENGARLNQKINMELKEIEKKIPSSVQFSKSCVLVSKMNPSYGGKGCAFDDVCTSAKVRNGIADLGVENGRLISKELMIKADPDYFLLSSGWEQKHPNESGNRDEFLLDPALKNLRAVREKHVLYIEDKYLYASNQNCIWAIRKLANLVYGNILSEEKEIFLKGY